MKLTGYKITVKSASGQVKSQVTGDEDYEIDTFKGLTDETRQLLIEHKLTTLNDLMRFRDKLDKMEELDEAQKALLTEKIEAGDKEEAARNEERKKMEAEFKAEIEKAD